MKRSFIVTVDIPDTTSRVLAAYIRHAVSCWGGQLHPDHPLFLGNWDDATLTVKPYKKDSTE